MAQRKFSLKEAVDLVVNRTPVLNDDDSDVEEYEGLQEACERATCSTRQVDIIVLPPSTVDAISDEEMIDEDDLQSSDLPRDVPGRVGVQFHDDDTDDEEPLSTCSPANKRSKPADDPVPMWGKKINYEKEIPALSPDQLSDVHPELVNKTPYEIFKLYFDKELVDMIVRETVRYAGQKNKFNFKLDDEDLHTFIGIILFSGYHALPRERMYWCRDEDVSVPFVSSAMSRNRFDDIKRYLHVANNNEVDAKDKMFKLRPLITAINQRFQQFGIFTQCLSIDEQMVPYYGRHSSKMFIRGKPIRFGFKLWVLASDDGYPYNVMVYCGKNRAAEGDENEGYGLGRRVVMSLLKCVNTPTCHEVFFDNFFTSYDLLVALRDISIKATGTVRENRLKKCPLLDTKLMKKKDRGVFDSKCNKSVMAVKWHDNQCVTIATNYDTVEPLGKAKRWSSAKKASVEVPQPAVIGSYNAHMGGVDILDRFLSTYRPIFRSKKWWWPLFINSLNLMVVAAWRVHVTVGGQHDQLSFRRHVVRMLLHSGGTAAGAQTGPGAKPLDEVRTDGVQHHLVPTGKQSRCRLCGKNARLECSKCRVPLHLHCESTYHAEQ